MKRWLKKAESILVKIANDHVGAYAAQSAFFFMLSLMPIILLLMTLVRVTPITQADIIEVTYEIFPKTFSGTIIAIVDEVYKQTGTTISISIFMAFWSAGRGILALSNGLSIIQGVDETRNYIYLRIRAAFYTVLFLIAIVLSLVLLGFGNSISILVRDHIPVFQYIIDFMIDIRIIVIIGILIVVTFSMYEFLPNRSGKPLRQIPGAIFTAFGWTFASFLFSIYMDLFKGFSNMYGSLTTIVLIMLWLYFCMYVILLGGEMNVLLEKRFEKDI